MNSALFLLELGWFLFFVLLLLIFLWRATQRKTIYIREANTLKLRELGTFMEDEGFDRGLRLFKFRFKKSGTKPQHIYSTLPWSIIKDLYLSAEVLVVEWFFPYLTLRKHKLLKSQYFNDPLVSPMKKSVLNYLKLFVYALVIFIPKLNRKAWSWVERDTSHLIKEVEVIESDIPKEQLEYLYRVEYTEEIFDKEEEAFSLIDQKKSLTIEEIEDLKDSKAVVKINSIRPEYEVVLKEKDEEITVKEILSEEELKKLEGDFDVKVKGVEKAFRVKYVDIEEKQSTEAILSESEVKRMKKEMKYSVIESEELVTVVYIEKRTDTPKKRVNSKIDTITTNELKEMERDPKYEVIEVKKGPYAVSYKKLIRKKIKQANLTKSEIEALKQDSKFTIVHVDETVQAKRIKSFADNPVGAMENFISFGNAIATQKMKTRRIAAEKAKLQGKLKETKEELYNLELEFASRLTDVYSKAVQRTTYNEIIIEKVLEKVFANFTAGVPTDEIKRIALRDFQIYLQETKNVTDIKQLKNKITEVEDKIKKFEGTNKLAAEKAAYIQSIKDLFPEGLEED